MADHVYELLYFHNVLVLTLYFFKILYGQFIVGTHIIRIPYLCMILYSVSAYIAANIIGTSHKTQSNLLNNLLFVIFCFKMCH